MQPFLCRYNRFTQSYLVNYHYYEFVAELELITILYTYYNTLDEQLILYELQNNGIDLQLQDLQAIIIMIESGKQQFSPHMKSQSFKVLDFTIKM